VVGEATVAEVAVEAAEVAEVAEVVEVAEVAEVAEVDLQHHKQRPQYNPQHNHKLMDEVSWARNQRFLMDPEVKAKALSKNSNYI
jgi:hypothetical protein